MLGEVGMSTATHYRWESWFRHSQDMGATVDKKSGNPNKPDPADLPLVSADPTRLRRVFENLLLP